MNGIHNEKKWQSQDMFSRYKNIQGNRQIGKYSSKNELIISTVEQ